MSSKSSNELIRITSRNDICYLLHWLRQETIPANNFHTIIFYVIRIKNMVWVLLQTETMPNELYVFSKQLK